MRGALRIESVMSVVTRRTTQTILMTVENDFICVCDGCF